jgi:phosphatidylserine decarboxylase
LDGATRRATLPPVLARTRSQTPPQSEPPSIRYVDRRTGELCTEVVMGEALVRYVYERFFGRALRRSLLTRPLFSRAYGRWQSSGPSRRAIGRVVRDLAIGLDDFESPPGGFASFNDFFTRTLKPGARPLDPDPRRLLSPADGRLFAFAGVRGDTLLPAKGRHISLARLLGDASAARPFADGSALIVRLCPSDYHRFHFPCAGVAGPARLLRGPLESVNPYALARGRAILDHNQRQVTMLDTGRFGRIAYVEVGALCVGRMVQTFRPGPVEAGQEKGYFEFGGSTVVLVFEPGRLALDADLVENTARGLETLVRMGEGIGRDAAE